MRLLPGLGALALLAACDRGLVPAARTGGSGAAATTAPFSAAPVAPSVIFHPIGRPPVRVSVEIADSFAER